MWWLVMSLLVLYFFMLNCKMNTDFWGECYWSCFSLHSVLCSKEVSNLGYISTEILLCFGSCVVEQMPLNLEGLWANHLCCISEIQTSAESGSGLYSFIFDAGLRCGTYPPFSPNELIKCMSVWQLRCKEVCVLKCFGEILLVFVEMNCRELYLISAT